MGGKYDLCACPAEFLQLPYEHIPQLHRVHRGITPCRRYCLRAFIRFTASTVFS